MDRLLFAFLLVFGIGISASASTDYEISQNLDPWECVKLTHWDFSSDPNYCPRIYRALSLRARAKCKKRFPEEIYECNIKEPNSYFETKGDECYVEVYACRSEVQD